MGVPCKSSAVPAINVRAAILVSVIYKYSVLQP